MKHLIVRFERTIKHTIDMGGFPEERMVENLDKVIVLEDYTEEDYVEASKLFMRYSPNGYIYAFADMRLQENQILKALIIHLSNKLSNVRI